MDLNSDEKLICVEFHKCFPNLPLLIEEIEESLLNSKKQNTYPAILDWDREIHIGSNFATLTSFEYDVASIGDQRTSAARKANKQDRRVDNRGAKSIEYEGICGELVYAKFHNLYPYETLSINPRDSKDDYGDFYHHQLRFDAKLTRHPHGKLFLASWKTQGKEEEYLKRVQALCLLTGVVSKKAPNEKIYLVGYLPAKVLISRELSRLSVKYDTLSYNAEQKELMDMGELLEWFKQNPIT